MASIAGDAKRAFLPGGIGGEHFPDPFFDISSLAMPDTWRNALQWCQYLYLQNDTYNQAMERVISYFLTEVELDSDDQEETEKWDDFHKKVLHLLTFVKDRLRDRQCYGNSFTSIVVPIKRFLRCPHCGLMVPLKTAFEGKEFQFQWQNMEFIATCPKKEKGHYRGPWKVHDEIDNADQKLKLKYWSPLEIEIVHDKYSDYCAYFWRIPEDYKNQVRRGGLEYIERIPLAVLKAIKENLLFRFHDGVLFHMKEPTLGGVINRGWGIPKLFTNFRQLWYVQVLKRYNEAIALDYVIPFRLITPFPRSTQQGGGGAEGSNDMFMTLNMGDFMSQVRDMIRRRRQNPAGWQTLPFPVQYQALGGDAANFAPKDMLQDGDDRLLNGAGVPVDFYRGTLQLQNTPVACRLFESHWSSLVADANDLINWIFEKSAEILRWSPMKPKLKRVTLADDAERQMMILQTFLARQVSGKTGLGGLGIDWKREQRQIAEEARFQYEMQAQQQEQMEDSGEAAAMASGQMAPPGGAGAPGGAPAGGGASGGASGGAAGQQAPQPGPVTSYLQGQSPGQQSDPQEMMDTASAIAQELLGRPDSLKNSELKKLKQHNPTLHAVVIAKIEEIRRDAKNQGGQQVLSQAYPQSQGQ